jgi:hypothetical protein
VKAYLWEEFTREDFDNEGWLGVYVYMYVCMYVCMYV